MHDSLNFGHLAAGLILGLTQEWFRELSFSRNVESTTSYTFPVQTGGILQDSKLGWSCGPSLPKLLSDYQIFLCGGPVVYF